MGVSTVPHEKMLRAIEILGTRVASMVRKELAAMRKAANIPEKTVCTRRSDRPYGAMMRLATSL